MWVLWGKAFIVGPALKVKKTLLCTGTFWCLFIKCMVSFVQISTQSHCIPLAVLNDHELFPLGVSWGDKDVNSLLGF